MLSHELFDLRLGKCALRRPGRLLVAEVPLRLVGQPWRTAGSCRGIDRPAVLHRQDVAGTYPGLAPLLALDRARSWAPILG